MGRRLPRGSCSASQRARRFHRRCRWLPDRSVLAAFHARVGSVPCPRWPTCRNASSNSWVHSPLRVSDVDEETTLVDRLVEMLRVSWTLAHEASNDAIDRVFRLFLSKILGYRCVMKRERT